MVSIRLRSKKSAYESAEDSHGKSSCLRYVGVRGGFGLSVSCSGRLTASLNGPSVGGRNSGAANDDTALVLVSWEPRMLFSAVPKQPHLLEVSSDMVRSPCGGWLIRQSFSPLSLEPGKPADNPVESASTSHGGGWSGVESVPNRGHPLHSPAPPEGRGMKR